MPFKPGQERPANAGRRAGTPNKLTRVMREDWLEAYERRGGVEFLMALDDETFAKGLLRMVPNAVEAKNENAVEVRHRIHIGPKPAESDPPSYAMWPGDESGE